MLDSPLEPLTKSGLGAAPPLRIHQLLHDLSRQLSLQRISPTPRGNRQRPLLALHDSERRIILVVYLDVREARSNQLPDEVALGELPHLERRTGAKVKHKIFEDLHAAVLCALEKNAGVA